MADRDFERLRDAYAAAWQTRLRSGDGPPGLLFDTLAASGLGSLCTPGPARDILQSAWDRGVPPEELDRALRRAATRALPGILRDVARSTYRSFRPLFERDDAEDYTGTDFYCDVAIPDPAALLVVHEDEQVLAFHHTKPHWETHVVVVPKRHIASLTTTTEADRSDLEALFAVVQQVARRVEREQGAAAVLTNLGAYQDSKHLHVHVHAGPLTRAEAPAASGRTSTTNTDPSYES